MAVFWVVALCRLVEVYQRFTGPCCLHHQGDEDSYLLISLLYISIFWPMNLDVSNYLITRDQLYVCIKVLLEKLKVAHIVKKHPATYETEIHDSVHQSPPLVTILRQVKAVHTIMYYFYKIHPNVTLPSTSVSSKWSLSFRLYDQTFVYTFHMAYASYIPSPSHPS
jgi:hypothetical protein